MAPMIQLDRVLDSFIKTAYAAMNLRKENDFIENILEN